MAKQPKPPKEKKSIVEKAAEKVADIVDQVMHPSADPAPEAPAVEQAKAEEPARAEVATESSSEKSDFQNHPKFAKFKPVGENQQ